MASDSVVFGVFITFVVVAGFFRVTAPEIKYEELYRFCLVKNIPLEECKIPPTNYQPVKKEISNAQTSIQSRPATDK